MDLFADTALLAYSLPAFLDWSGNLIQAKFTMLARGEHVLEDLFESLAS